MFNLVKRQLVARRLKQLITLATETLYSEQFEISAIVTRLDGDKGSTTLLRAYIAMTTAARITAPLNDADVADAVEQLNAAEQCVGTQTFDAILDCHKELAELSWMRRQLKILRGKLARRNDEDSYEGTIYAFEQSRKGPISNEDREKAKTLSVQIGELNRQIEEEQLKELAASDASGYQRMKEELEIRSLQSEVDSSDFEREEAEADDLIRSLKQKLDGLIQSSGD